MIIVKIQGGLGNQMSELSMCYLLRELYPNVDIQLDTYYYEYNSCHNGFELERLFGNLEFPKASLSDICKITGQTKNLVCYAENSKYLRGLLWLIYKSNRLIRKFHVNKTIIAQAYLDKYAPDMRIYNLDPKKDYYLDGTWHNYDYSCCIDVLQQFFVPKTTVTEENIKHLNNINSTQSVSVHIRRGDYVGTDLDIVGEQYYKNALAYIQNNVKSPHYFIFSDDKQYATELLHKMNIQEFTIISNNKGIDSFFDIMLMSKCKHNIIANSTFSYWGAVLNNNSNKIVIRPKWQAKNKETWQVPGWLLME